VNFGLLAAEIDPVVWGTPANFNGFRVLAALLHGSQVAKLCSVEQRAPPMFGRATIMLGIGPTSSLVRVSISSARFFSYSICTPPQCNSILLHENTKTESIYFDGKSFTLSSCGWAKSSGCCPQLTSWFIVKLNYMYSKFKILNFVVHLLILHFC